MERNLMEILTFNIDERRFAICIHAVEKVIRAVAITKLIDNPDFFVGVIDYHGEVIAVINLRKRLGYPLQELQISDRFIIAITPERKIALIVDDIDKLIIPDAIDISNSKDLNAGMKYISVLRDDAGILFIYDLENLLSKTEDIQLEQFLSTSYFQNF